MLQAYHDFYIQHTYFSNNESFNVNCKDNLLIGEGRQIFDNELFYLNYLAWIVLYGVGSKLLLC